MKALLSLAFFLFASAASAYDQKVSWWTDNTITGAVNDADGKPTQFYWGGEFFPHVFLKPFPALDQVENYGSFGMKFDYDLSAAVGAGFIAQQAPKVFEPFAEARSFEQISYQPKVGPAAFGLRLRLEERFFAVKPFDLRARFVTSFFYSLTDMWSVGIRNELFAHTLNPSFDQDRLFVGSRYKLSKLLTVEGGYQPVFTLKGVEHAVMTNLIFTVE